VTNHDLLSVARISAQGTSDVVNQTSLWLQEIQAISAVATTLGVLIALYVAAIREPRKAAAESRRHKAQMDALRRAHRKRVTAQARKVIPYSVRTPMFGGSWWTVGIDNASNAIATILEVEVKAIGTNGLEVPDGCKQVDNATTLDQVFDRSVLAVLSESLDGGLQQPSFGEMTSVGVSVQRSNRKSQAFKQALRDALIGHFATEWQRVLPPHQHTVMAYTTTRPDYTLRVAIDYEDEAGYQWRRTDTSQPKLLGN
jgi:hypothetical protein